MVIFNLTSSPGYITQIPDVKQFYNRHIYYYWLITVKSQSDKDRHNCEVAAVASPLRDHAHADRLKLGGCRWSSPIDGVVPPCSPPWQALCRASPTLATTLLASSSSAPRYEQGVQSATGRSGLSSLATFPW